MRRRIVLPAAIALLAAFAWAFQDSPIIVGDSSSIHFTRNGSDRFQTEAAGMFAHDANRTVRSISVGNSGEIALGAGWRVDLVDSAVVAHINGSGNMDTIHVDAHGHGVNMAAANHGVIPNVHLRSIVVTPRGGAGAQSFSCPAGAECFRIHYR